MSIDVAEPQVGKESALAECPDDATIAELVEGLLSAEARTLVHDHIARCSQCRRLVSEFARGGVAPGTGEPLAADAVSAEDSLGSGDDSNVLLPGRQLGRYVVLARVGVGGLGEVYAAYDPELDRRIAVKLLRATSRADGEVSQGQERLLREAKALAKLSHANVVAVHDVGIIDHRVFVAMEFVEGSTLREWLRERPRTWREIVESFRAAGRGLLAAHDAGLVHRDFKPDNVLVRRDGHVCVTDFGLARAELVAERAREVEGAETEAPLATLTQTGELVGTPAYMAPEQFAGRPVDARTDQFAFAVTLFEALYGKRPFLGGTLRELASAVTLGKPCEAPAAGDVPAWLHRAVRRGLSVEPEERFSSMRELLDALVPPSAAWRQWAWVGASGAAAVVAIAVALGARKQPPAPLPVCRGGADKLAMLWGEPQRGAVRQAFAATGAAYAATTLRTVEGSLDGYARDWVASYTEACEATRVRGEQSEQLLDQRMVCLEQRRKEAAALIDLYAHADAKTVEKAVESASALSPSLSFCAANALSGAPPVPSGSAARAKLDEVQGEIAGAEALRDQGQFKDALDRGRTIVEAATSLAFTPVLAEARFRVAEDEFTLGDTEAAVKDARDAAFEAESMRMDALSAHVWGTLVRYAADQGKYDDGRLYARLAGTAIGRLGGAPGLEAELLTSSTDLEIDEGNYAEALAVGDRALALIERSIGTQSRAYVSALSSRSGALAELGRYDEALADNARAYDITVETLGPEHKRTATILTGGSGILYLLGRYEESIAMSLRALPMWERLVGTEHPDFAISLIQVGSGLVAEGRVEEARSYEERALRIFEARLPEELPYAGSAYGCLAELELGAGNLTAAEHDAQKAIGTFESAPGDAQSQAAEPLDLLARVHRAQGRMAKALEDAGRAVAIAEKARGPDHPIVADYLTTKGDVLAARGASSEARGALERAIRIFEAHPADPHKLARARALLAKLD